MTDRAYFVTGANSGCGLEAARLLALHFSEHQHQSPLSENGDGATNKEHCEERNANTTTIYLLCRSEKKAQDAIQDIRTSLRSVGGTNSEHVVRLEFLQFNAYDDEATIRRNIALKLGKEANPPTLGGILLNAGGFGETEKTNRNSNSYSKNKNKNTPNSPTTTTTTSPERGPEACGIAKLNLIGHVFLFRHLMAFCQIDDQANKPRIVPVGSEATVCTPGMDCCAADFVAHLRGTVPAKDKRMGVNYAWTKTILALYWAAFARHNPQFEVVTVSPGAVPGTQLLKQQQVTPALRAVAAIGQLPCFGGHHTVQDGAERYLAALLGMGDLQEPIQSGSFWASRKGFCRDFGDMTTLKKGKCFGDTDLQDKAWAAVQKFV